MRKITKNEFLKRAYIKHNNRYDYSNINFINMSTPIKIFCKTHGFFWQSPTDHLKCNGCPKCSTHHTFTTKEFITKATIIHNNKYNYTKTKYTKSRDNVEIICPIHGSFIQRASHHLEGEGCPKCAQHKRTPVYKDFIKKAKQIHGNKYNYTKVNYTTLNKKVCIICPTHGEFLQTPRSHIINKHGCPLCGRLVCRNKFKRTTKQFITKAQKIHGHKYDYTKTKYGPNSKEKVIITCPIHGDFLQTPNAHLQGAGCPQCSSSYGEQIINTYLMTHHVNFIQQYRFGTCKNKQPLPFDFVLFNKNNKIVCAIEYQGKQHFTPILTWGGEKTLKRTQKHDKIKQVFCKHNKIKLLTITYKQNINKVLNKYLSIFKKLNII